MLSSEVQKGGKGFDDLGDNTTHVNPVTEKEEDKRVREPHNLTQGQCSRAFSIL